MDANVRSNTVTPHAHHSNSRPSLWTHCWCNRTYGRRWQERCIFLEPYLEVFEATCPTSVDYLSFDGAGNVQLAGRILHILHHHLHHHILQWKEKRENTKYIEWKNIDLLMICLKCNCYIPKQSGMLSTGLKHHLWNPTHIKNLPVDDDKGDLILEEEFEIQKILINHKTV